MLLRLKQILRTRMTAGSVWANACGRVHRRLWGRVLPWSPNLTKLEIELTTACNLRCPNCNRATSLAPSLACMTESQIDRFVGESLSLGWRWQRIALTGGEPTLHPRLIEVIGAIERYKREYPSCEVAVVTNGHGGAVHKVLSRVPEWVVVKNSAKTGDPPEFEPFNQAPIDLPGARGMNFNLGCSITEICGIGLSRHGYYPCGPAATIDRVFGKDLGIKSLAHVSTRHSRAQMAALCGLCGHFLSNHGAPKTSRQEVSVSWEAALKRHEIEPHALTLW